MGTGDKIKLHRLGGHLMESYINGNIRHVYGEIQKCPGIKSKVTARQILPMIVYKMLRDAQGEQTANRFLTGYLNWLIQD